MDRNEIVKELRRVQADFHQLISSTSALLTCAAAQGHALVEPAAVVHMVFGYGIVRTLLPLVRALGPSWTQRRGFAAALDAGSPPVPPDQLPVARCGGGRLLTPRAQARAARPHARCPATRTRRSDRRVARAAACASRTAWDPDSQADHERAGGLPLRRPAAASAVDVRASTCRCELLGLAPLEKDGVAPARRWCRPMRSRTPRVRKPADWCRAMLARKAR